MNDALSMETQQKEQIDINNDENKHRQERQQSQESKLEETSGAQQGDVQEPNQTSARGQQLCMNVASSYNRHWVSQALLNQKTPSQNDTFVCKFGKVLTIQQKYRTSLCKHWKRGKVCPLGVHCQFAHGYEELRKPDDPLPENFGQVSLGAVHSNYKTQPCRHWFNHGTCKYGDKCSYYHGDYDKRNLIDPISNLAEGVQLPPMPEKLRISHKEGRYNHNYNSQFIDNSYSQSYHKIFGQTVLNVSSAQFNHNSFNNMSPTQQYSQQMVATEQLQSSFGFDPNKYLKGPQWFTNSITPINSTQITYQPNVILTNSSTNAPIDKGKQTVD